MKRVGPGAILVDEVDSSHAPVVGQLAVFASGHETVDVAYPDTEGESDPRSTMYNIWCGTKPVFHVAALHTMWNAGCHDAALGDLVPEDVRQAMPTSVASLRLWQLISHEVGLPQPHVMQAMHVPIGLRLDSVLRSIEVAGDVAGSGTYAPSKLLEVALGHVAGKDPAAVVDNWCSDHLKYADELRFNVSPDDLLELADRIGPYVLDHYTEPVKSYHDRIASVACQDRLAAGGFASMRALADFYSVIAGGGDLDSTFVDWLWSRPPTTVFDAEANLEVQFVCGFHLGVPRFESDAHVLAMPGLTGASLGFAVRESQLGAAFMVNRFFQNTDDINFFRQRMVRVILDKAKSL